MDMLTDKKCDEIWGADKYNFSGKEQAAIWYRTMIRAAYSLGAAAQRKRDADIAWGHVDDHRNMASTIARQIEDGS
jgi:hypothetical protein